MRREEKERLQVIYGDRQSEVNEAEFFPRRQAKRWRNPGCVLWGQPWVCVIENGPSFFFFF